MVVYLVHGAMTGKLVTWPKKVCTMRNLRIMQKIYNVTASFCHHSNWSYKITYVYYL